MLCACNMAMAMMVPGYLNGALDMTKSKLWNNFVENNSNQFIAM